MLTFTNSRPITGVVSSDVNLSRTPLSFNGSRKDFLSAGLEPMTRSEVATGAMVRCGMR